MMMAHVNIQIKDMTAMVIVLTMQMKMAYAMILIHVLD